jgi:hypothetical protein
VPRRVFRVVECVCGEKVPLLLGDLDSAECHECGAQYDARTGAILPVCEGFEVPDLKRRVVRFAWQAQETSGRQRERPQVSCRRRLSMYEQLPDRLSARPRDRKLGPTHAVAAREYIKPQAGGRLEGAPEPL